MYIYIYMHIWILYIHRNIYTPCWATFSLCIFCVCMVSRLTILYWTIIKRTYLWGTLILLLPGVISGLQFLISVWDSCKISPSVLIRLFIHLFQSFFMQLFLEDELLNFRVWLWTWSTCLFVLDDVEIEFLKARCKNSTGTSQLFYVSLN